MRDSISNEELILICKDLFLSHDNNEREIDFQILVRDYEAFLSLFFDVESSFYGDLEFQLFVINSFNYLYKSIFGDENIDSYFVSLALSRHDSELREKNACLESVDYTDSDFVYVFTLRLAMTFRDMGLMFAYYEDMQKLLFNSYVIENMEKGYRRDGMENRKCYN